MNNEYILLSVSMLISGRDEMEKSLKSLLYFKNAFPTEIILVDTGCNVEQRALAEKYADKIIDFTWCNDFAAARNAGLKEAHGEWFMFLDDDEWFDDPKEIITFFKSGEYQKYNSASYVIRNYLDFEGVSYVTSYPSRMVRREKETHFIGKVHEYLSPYNKPVKEFTDFVHHYGYAYKSMQEEVAHAWRNIKPLLEMRKENPGNTRWMYQLGQEYFAIKNYDKTVKSCQESLADWEQYKNKEEYYPTHIGTLYGYILFSLEYLGKYEEEKEWLNKALNLSLNDQKVMEVSIVFYNLAGARLYGILEDVEQCVSYFKRYIEGLIKFENNRDVMETETEGIVSNVFHNVYYSEAVLICLPALLHKKEYKLAQESLNRIEWKEKNVFFQRKCAKKIIDTCCNTEIQTFYEEIFQKFTEGEEGIHEMYPVFRDLQMEYTQYREDDKLGKLRCLVAALDNDHFYVQASKIIWEWEEGQKDVGLIQECFRKLFMKCPDHILEVEDKVWEIAREMQIDVASLLLQMDYRTWRRALESMEHWASLEEWEKWNHRVQGWKRSEDIRYELFEIKYAGSSLAKITKETDSISELEEQLWKYADQVFDFYHPYYKEEALEEIPIGLPDELQLALELRKLHVYRESGQERNALECMKKCLGIYPKLDKTMLAYAEMLRDELQRQNAEVDAAKQELQQMAESLKTMAKAQISQGNMEAAKQILLQTSQYVPEDEEIKTLLEQMK